MRYSILFIAFMLFSGIAFAQNAASDFKYGLKLSNQTTWNYRRISDTNGGVLAGGTVQVFNVQPAFLLKGSKGNFWEFSLQNIRTNIGSRAIANDPNSRLYNLGLNAKVGYFYAFFKQKTTHWIPMLGLEVAPNFGLSRNRQFNQIAGSTYVTNYLTNRSSLGAELFLTPRMMWCPGKRFFMDASMNIGLVMANYSHAATTNPAASTPVRTSTNVSWPLDGAHLSLGFGLKI